MSHWACVNWRQWWRACVWVIGVGGILSSGRINLQWQVVPECTVSTWRQWMHPCRSLLVLGESTAGSEENFPTSQFPIDKNSAVMLIAYSLRCTFRGAAEITGVLNITKQTDNGWNATFTCGLQLLFFYKCVVAKKKLLRIAAQRVLTAELSRSLPCYVRSAISDSHHHTPPSSPSK